MDKNNIEFMNEAIRMAEDNVSSLNGGPFGAIVVKNGKIVGSGVNMVTSSNDPTAHAEIVAIRNACEALNTHELDDCEIYTSCEPCPMCLGAIYWARPKKIYYACTKDDAADAGFDDSYIYDEMALSIEKREIPAVQLMREKALKVFNEWKININKVEY